MLKQLILHAAVPMLCMFHMSWFLYFVVNYVFSRFGISKTLIKNITNCGYEEPTPIQMQAVSIMMKVSHSLFIFSCHMCYDIQANLNSI